MLVYSVGSEFPETQAVWFDRDGKELEKIGEPGRNLILNLSPDEKRLAMSRADSQRNTLAIWIRDLVRNVDSPMRKEPSEFDTDPQWSPDGAHLFFTWGQTSGRKGLLQIDLNGGEVE